MRNWVAAFVVCTTKHRPFIIAFSEISDSNKSDRECARSIFMLIWLGCSTQCIPLRLMRDISWIRVLLIYYFIWSLFLTQNKKWKGKYEFKLRKKVTLWDLKLRMYDMLHTVYKKYSLSCEIFTLQDKSTIARKKEKLWTLWTVAIAKFKMTSET